MAKVFWEETVLGGSTWSHVLKRKTALRIVDPTGGANVGMLLYNADNPAERYNMADTLKAQHIARFTRNDVLMSDMGRVLCSVTEDTCGWHDPLGGVLNARQVEARYGKATYQDHRNHCLKNGLDSFLIELGKHGLGWRDLAPNINFFSKVAVRADGTMAFVMDNSAPGSYVELRAEMNTLIVLHTCPHPMDPAHQFSPKPVQLSIRHAAPVEIDDPCRIACDENTRAFTLTERYFL
jgi:urea carboxylase-associated protein 2